MPDNRVPKSGFLQRIRAWLVAIDESSAISEASLLSDRVTALEKRLRALDAAGKLDAAALSK